MKTEEMVWRRAYLSGLPVNPPETHEEIAECLDTILMYWSEALADDGELRERLGEQIAKTLKPFLNQRGADG